MLARLNAWFANTRLSRIEMKLDMILKALTSVQTAENQLIEGNEKIMANQNSSQAAIDAATAQITAMTSLEQSAVAALNTTNQRIADAVSAFQAANPTVDTSALTAAVTLEQANATTLAAAITANTPAAATVDPNAPTQAPAV